MYIYRKLEDTINKYLKTPEIIAALDARSLFDNSLKDLGRVSEFNF